MAGYKPRQSEGGSEMNAPIIPSKKKSRKDSVIERLDPIKDPSDLYDIIKTLMDAGQNTANVMTVEEWLMDNYPTDEELHDAMDGNDQVYKHLCSDCAHRDQAWGGTGFPCALPEMPKIVNSNSYRLISCRSHRTEFRTYHVGRIQ